MGGDRQTGDRRGRWLGIGLAAAAGLAGLVAWVASPSDEQRWRRIERALEDRRWEEAEAGLSRWLVRHPDDDRARLQWGAVLGALDREEEAREELARVGESSPAWARAQFLLGELAANRHDGAEAERAYREAIGREPGAIEPRVRLLSLMFVQRRAEEACRLLRELDRLTGDPRHLVTLTGLALEGRQAEQFRDLGGEGEQLLDRLRPFLERSPDDPWLRRARGLIRFELGTPAEAVADLEFARLAIENDPDVRLALAACYAATGRADRVEEALGPMPALPADRARWWLLLGQASRALGREDEAIDHWRQAVAADPGHLQAHYRLGRALAEAGRADEAGPILERAEGIRDRTDRLKAAINGALSGLDGAGECLVLGRLCEESGMPALARRWFEQAARLDPLDRASQQGIARLAEAAFEPVAPPRLRNAAGTPSGGVATAGVAERSPSGPVRARFEDEAASRGLVFRYDPGEAGDLFIADTMGGGVGLIDSDGDGWLDVYFVNGCPLPVDPDDPPAPNRLFRNRGDGTFEDVTDRAGVGGRGYGMGCAVGDYDGDGDDDLFVTGFGATVLYRNNGDGTFADVTGSAGVASDRWSTASGFADLDGDGDLDLVVVTYVEADPATAPPCSDPSGEPIHCPPGRFPAQEDLLFRNNGDGTFTDVSREAGLDRPGRGLGLAIVDADEDGTLDLFIANDAEADFLFLNRGGLRFEEQGVAAGAAFDGDGRATASMGVIADDLDGDGRIDLYHTNFRNEPDTLLRNLGNGLFFDATSGSGLEGPSLAVTGFGAVALDGENDGALDLFVANGHVDDQPGIGQPMAQPPRWYSGLGRGRFETASPGEVGPYFRRPVVGRGAAGGDLDNDGRVDLVVVHRDAPASLLRNVSPGAGHWLGVRLVGSSSGPTPVGARVTCRAGGRSMTRVLSAGTSYLSASDPRLHFGLGAAEQVDELEIRWPSGAVERHAGLAADRIVEFREAVEPASER
ncbi:FG-GAP-like repeat-containing protein [Tautonia sociabilis]|uniref:Tetratricopeptide repeat protein n=1 Tax=Tautonia sociabilis TaxID=2080755 RepID=A0A432MMM4_9BACT|nr:FG-GAP-like repeat-containing protein [Tautonia sociabilis]RUL88672.1 tetratricopeptide repeat protein [Tautonia sociabilis]